MVCDAKGPPEQVAPVRMTSDILSVLVPAIKEHGGTVLEIKVWADWSPTWYTLYKIEVTAHGSPALLWIAILAVLALLLITIIVYRVTGTNWGGPLGKALEDIKTLGFIALGIVALLVLTRKGGGVIVVPQAHNPGRRK